MHRKRRDSGARVRCAELRDQRRRGLCARPGGRPEPPIDAEAEEHPRGRHRAADHREAERLQRGYPRPSRRRSAGGESPASRCWKTTLPATMRPAPSDLRAGDRRRAAGLGTRGHRRRGAGATALWHRRLRAGRRPDTAARTGELDALNWRSWCAGARASGQSGARRGYPAGRGGRP